MPNNVAIYINKNCVDLVQLSAGFQGLKVINSLRVPIPVSSTEPPEKNTIAEAVKEAVKKAKLKNVAVTLVLPAQEVIMRYFQMPIMPVKERHSAIIFEAKKYIPFKLEEIAADYSVAEIEKTATTGLMDVVFAAVKKDLLKEYLNYITQAGLKVKAVEPAPVALLRWYKFSSLTLSKKSVALLDLEADNLSLTITIIKNEIPCFVREITLPNKLILESGSEFDKNAFERLLSEMHISFEYYKKWFQGEMVEKIILFSQTGIQKPLTDSFSKEIDVPVEMGSVKKGLKPKGFLSSELYLTAGAALENKVKTKIKLNLYRSPQIVWFEGKKGIKKAVITEAVLAFLFLAGVYFIASGPVNSGQERLKNIISHRPPLGENIDVNSFEALNEAKDNLIKKRTLLADLIKNRFYWTPQLKALVNLVPEGIWLTETEFNQTIGNDISSPGSGYRLLIKAKAFISRDKSADSLTNKFLENLRKDRYIGNVFKEIGTSSLKTEQVPDGQLITFEISATSEIPQRGRGR